MKLKPKFRNNLNFKKQCHFSADRAFKIMSLLSFAGEIVKSPQPKNPKWRFLYPFLCLSSKPCLFIVFFFIVDFIFHLVISNPPHFTALSP